MTNWPPEDLRGRPVVAVAATAMQVINATEALAQLELGKAELILIGPRLSRQAVSRFPGIERWARIHQRRKHDAGRRAGAVSWISRAVDALADYLHVRRICHSPRAKNVLAVLGHPRRLVQQYAVWLLGADTVIICDDGASSLVFNQDVSPGVSRLNRSERWLAVLLGMPKRWSLPRPVYFTALGAAEGARKETNDYSTLRAASEMPALTTLDQVWFIAQPLYVDGFLRKADYIAFLRYIEARYERLQMCYLPHPAESSDDIREIIAMTGWKLMTLDLPIELELVRDGTRPQRLATFYSSVYPLLERLALPDIGMDAFRPPGHRWRSGPVRTRQVQELYRHFSTLENPHFTVLEIPEEIDIARQESASSPKALQIR